MKIRYKTWWWGKWILSGSKLDSSIVTIDTEGFEPYVDSIHGAHNEFL